MLVLLLGVAVLGAEAAPAQPHRVAFEGLLPLRWVDLARVSKERYEYEYSRFLRWTREEGLPTDSVAAAGASLQYENGTKIKTGHKKCHKFFFLKKKIAGTRALVICVEGSLNSGHL